MSNFKFEPTQMPSLRYVIHSTSKGVHLGNGKWSRTDPRHASAAPTYTKEDGEAVSLELGVDQNLTDLMLVIVYPDRVDRASPFACAASALPTWDHAEGVL